MTALVVAVRTWGSESGPSVNTLKHVEPPSGGSILGPGEMPPEELSAELDAAFGPAQSRRASPPLLLLKGAWILLDPLLGVSIAALAVVFYQRRRKRSSNVIEQQTPEPSL